MSGAGTTVTNTKKRARSSESASLAPSSPESSVESLSPTPTEDEPAPKKTLITSTTTTTVTTTKALPASLVTLNVPSAPIGYCPPAMFINNTSQEALQADQPTNPNGSRAGRWTSAEHRKFLEVVELQGSRDWHYVASYVGTRTAEQVRSHAQKYLKRPELRRHVERTMLLRASHVWTPF